MKNIAYERITERIVKAPFPGTNRGRQQLVGPETMCRRNSIVASMCFCSMPQVTNLPAG